MGQKLLCVQCVAVRVIHSRVYIHKNPVKFWRAQGIKIIMYLDDGIAAAENLKKANKISENIHSDLEKFVFLIAEEKSDWLPKQSVKCLGLNINFQHR